MASFKPSSSFLSRLARPSHRRTASNSSEASHASVNSSASDEQFVFSAGNTPSGENPPSLGPGPNITSNPRDGLLLGRPAITSRSQPNPHDLARQRAISLSATSQPIAIAPPAARQPTTAPAVVTPPEPLSARGDLPGGYFPFHEDPTSRVRQGHPFQVDTIQARRASIRQASIESGSTAKMSASINQVRKLGSVSKSPQFAFGRIPDAASSGSHTPVSSYLPIGANEGAALPMGKYYPSNYENTSAYRQRPVTKSNLTASIKSEPQVPKYRREASHTRTGSDVKLRLLQYQRDMIAQATVAASALLEKNGANVDPKTLAAGSSLKHINLGGTMLKTHKPLSPRLAPLGSPGPVTPMELEGPGGDGYLTAKQAPNLPKEVLNVKAPNTSAEKAKQYQKSTHMPASEFHASSF
ncbi:hypothetical protein V8F33_011748 [Rhypophila sp. PSN 637]